MISDTVRQVLLDAEGSLDVLRTTIAYAPLSDVALERADCALESIAKLFAVLTITQPAVAPDYSEQRALVALGAREMRGAA